MLSHARAGCSTPKSLPQRFARAALALALLAVGLVGPSASGAPLSGIDDPPSYTIAPVVVSVPQASRADTVVFVGPPPPPRGRATSEAEPGAASVGAVALASITYPWQERLPGWSIRFEPGTGSLRGVTDADTDSVVVYVAAGESAASVARVLAHELGHAVDLTFNDTGARRHWETARGIGDEVPWWTTNTAADFATGSGDFAECFASWQVGSRSRSAFGPCSTADIELVALMS